MSRTRTATRQSTRVRRPSARVAGEPVQENEAPPVLGEEQVPVRPRAASRARAAEDFDGGGVWNVVPPRGRRGLVVGEANVQVANVEGCRVEEAAVPVGVMMEVVMTTMMMMRPLALVEVEAHLAGVVPGTIHRMMAMMAHPVVPAVTVAVMVALVGAVVVQPVLRHPLFLSILRMC
jgi:hypothetical protein